MKKICLSTLLMFTVYLASAQLNIDVLGSLPTGDFSDDAGQQDDGFAKFGFGASAGYFIETGVEGLGIYPSVSFIFNGSDIADELVKSLQQSAQAQNIQANFEGDGGNYFTIPITVGPSYKGEVGDGLFIYGTGHIGIGLNITSQVEVSGSGQNFNYNAEIESNSPVSFAGGIEGGVIFADQFKFGFQFLSLGEPEYEFESAITQNGQTQNINSESELPKAMFLIKFGIVL